MLIKLFNCGALIKSGYFCGPELPFGKNTKSQDLLLLYSRFLENAKKSTAKIVVSFPHFVDYKTICRKTACEEQVLGNCYFNKNNN